MSPLKTDVDIGGMMRQEFDIPSDAAYVDHGRFRDGDGSLRGCLEIQGAFPGTLGCIVTRDVPQGKVVLDNGSAQRIELTPGCDDRLERFERGAWCQSCARL